MGSAGPRSRKQLVPKVGGEGRETTGLGAGISFKMNARVSPWETLGWLTCSLQLLGRAETGSELEAGD